MTKAAIKVPVEGKSYLNSMEALQEQLFAMRQQLHTKQCQIKKMSFKVQAQQLKIGQLSGQNKRLLKRLTQLQGSKGCDSMRITQLQNKVIVLELKVKQEAQTNKQLSQKYRADLSILKKKQLNQIQRQKDLQNELTGARNQIDGLRREVLRISVSIKEMENSHRGRVELLERENKAKGEKILALAEVESKCKSVTCSTLNNLAPMVESTKLIQK